jgi:hypothetical protein
VRTTTSLLLLNPPIPPGLLVELDTEHSSVHTPDSEGRRIPAALVLSVVVDGVYVPRKRSQREAAERPGRGKNKISLTRAQEDGSIPAVRIRGVSLRNDAAREPKAVV